MKLRTIILDLTALAGVALIGWGLWLAWPPFALIWGGLASLAASVALAFLPSPPPPEKPS